MLDKGYFKVGDTFAGMLVGELKLPVVVDRTFIFGHFIFGFGQR